MQRRTLIQAASVMAAGTLAWPVAAQARPQMEVWKSPTCGCCKDWVAHMESHGFSVRTHETGNNAVRARLGLPQELGSCHTALVNGYVIEGHVPVREVRRLLAERPQALGLSVPGMPVGAPGMDGPAYGNRKDPFNVLLVQASGKTRVYQAYS